MEAGPALDFHRLIISDESGLSFAVFEGWGIYERMQKLTL